jgi:hypothetical protein
VTVLLWGGRLRRLYFVGWSPVTVLLGGAVACDGFILRGGRKCQWRIYFVGRPPVTVLFCGAVACDGFCVTGRSLVMVAFCWAVACHGFIL